MYGEDFDFEDKAVAEVKQLTKMVLDYCSPTNKGSEVESFPFLRKIPYIKWKYIAAEEEIKKKKKETIGVRTTHYKVNSSYSYNLPFTLLLLLCSQLCDK